MIICALNNVASADITRPVDNFVSRLCHRWTFWVLIVFSFIITCRLAFGDSFACQSSDSFLQSKCYWEVFTDGSTSEYDSQNRDRAYSPSSDSYSTTGQQLVYYPWVNLLFLGQAAVFLVPYLIWRAFEGGRVSQLTAGLRKNFGKEHKHQMEILCLAKYVLLTQGTHKLFALMHLLLDVGNFVVCLSQNVWLMSFFGIGSVPDYNAGSVRSWKDYRDLYFPSSTTCSVSKFTRSGERMTDTTTCILPLNQLYMNVYLILHGWYIFLAVATGIVVIYRLSLVMPFCRKKILYFLSPMTKKSDLQSLTYRLDYSDWVFLGSIQKVVTELEYSELLDTVLAMSRGDKMKDDGETSSIDEKRLQKGSGSILTSPL